MFSLPLNNISKFTINLCRLMVTDTLHNIQMFINELKQKLFSNGGSLGYNKLSIAAFIFIYILQSTYDNTHVHSSHG